MAIAFRAAGAVASVTSSASITVATPAGVQAGDVMLAVFGSLYTLPANIPSGWTLLNSYQSDFYSAVYFRVATATEPASYTWSGIATSGNLTTQGVVVAYSGTDPLVPILGMSGQAPTNDSIAMTSSYLPGAFIVGLFGVGIYSYTYASGAAPTGMTARTPYSQNVLVADVPAPAPGSTTPAYSVSPVPSYNMSYGILLRPAGAGVVIKNGPGVTNSAGINGPASTNCDLVKACDYYVACVFSTSTQTLSASSSNTGWTLVESLGDGTGSPYELAIYTTPASGGPNIAVNANAYAYMFVVNGCPPGTSPIEVISGQQGPASLNVPFPTISARANQPVLYVADAYSNTLSAPTGTVVPPGATGVSYLGVFTETPAAAGVTTQRTSTGGNSYLNNAITLSLQGVSQTPPAPSLLTPLSGAVIDTQFKGVVVSATFNGAADGVLGGSFALRASKDGGTTYQYWNESLQQFQSTITWSVRSPFANGATVAVALPPGALSDGNTWSWSMAFRAASSPGGAFASDSTFSAQKASQQQELFINNAGTSLTGTGLPAGNVGDTATVTVAAASLPNLITGSGHYRVTLGSAAPFEYVWVTAVSGTTWTILRGQEGSSALAWGFGTPATPTITAGALAALSAAKVQRYVQEFYSDGIFIVPDGVLNVDLVMVGGGGAGGTNNYSASTAAGGGGAGGYFASTIPVSPGSYVVTVGAGAPSPGIGQIKGGDGGATSFGNLTVAGGSGGTYNGPANNGGSCGGQGTSTAGGAAGGGGGAGGAPAGCTGTAIVGAATAGNPGSASQASWPNTYSPHGGQGIGGRAGGGAGGSNIAGGIAGSATDGGGIMATDAVPGTGGGGGGGYAAAVPYARGGAGGSGYVRVTWWA